MVLNRRLRGKKISGKNSGKYRMKKKRWKYI